MPLDRFHAAQHLVERPQRSRSSPCRDYREIESDDTLLNLAFLNQPKNSRSEQITTPKKPLHPTKPFDQSALHRAITRFLSSHQNPYHLDRLIPDFITPENPSPHTGASATAEPLFPLDVTLLLGVLTIVDACPRLADPRAP